MQSVHRSLLSSWYASDQVRLRMDGGDHSAQGRAPTGFCDGSAYNARLGPVIVAAAAEGAAGDGIKEHLPDGQHSPCKPAHAAS